MAVNDIMISVFLSVAETKSFTKTANAMYLTQQAVSKNIARYEAHLGFKLFDRTTRIVTLTDAGNAIYEFLRDSMGNYHKLIDQIKHHAYVIPTDVSKTTEESEELSRIMNEVYSYTNEMTLRFITGSDDIESGWNQYVETLNSLGIEEAAQIYSDCYVRYLER